MTNPLPASYSMGKSYKCSLKIRNKTGMSAFTFLIHIVLGVVATVMRQEEEIKGIQIVKEEVKLSLIADYSLAYIQNPKDSTKTY